MLSLIIIIEMKKLTDSYSYEYSFFPAILQGDDVRAREILDVIKSRGVSDPATPQPAQPHPVFSFG